MEVVFYPSHYNLPFTRNVHARACQPMSFFNPIVMRSWVERRSGLVAMSNSIWPVLLGLYNLDSPEMLAHVSANFWDGRYSLPSKTWVQISTVTGIFDVKSIPLVVRDGKVLVDHLWGGDNGTITPYQLPENDLIRKNKESFWEDYFYEELEIVFHKAVDVMKRLRQARGFSRLYVA
jgi:hypothetical protein